VPPSGAHLSHRDVLNRLGPTPTALDHLARALQTRPDDLGYVLAELEMNGQVRRHSGGLFSLRG
jgi:DNA processing protein